MGRGGGAIRPGAETGFRPRPHAGFVAKKTLVAGAAGWLSASLQVTAPAVLPAPLAVSAAAGVSPGTGASRAGCHRIVPRLRLPPTPAAAEMGGPGCAPPADGGMPARRGEAGGRPGGGALPAAGSPCRPTAPVGAGAGAGAGAGSTGGWEKRSFLAAGSPSGRRAGTVASPFPKRPFLPARRGFGQRGGRGGSAGTRGHRRRRRAEEVGSAGRPRAPLCPRRRQRWGSPPPSLLRAERSDAGGWGRLPAGRQPPRGLLQALSPVSEGSGAGGGASCPLFVFLAVSSPRGIPPALPLPRPGLFFLWFKDKTLRFRVVPSRRPRPRRGSPPRRGTEEAQGSPGAGVPPPFPPAMRGLVFWFESVSTWGSLSRCVCVWVLDPGGGNRILPSSDPAGCWPLICLSGCHYRHFQNQIPAENRRLALTRLRRPFSPGRVGGWGGAPGAVAPPPGTHPRGSGPAALSTEKPERDPTAAPLPVSNWHLKFHLHL